MSKQRDKQAVIRWIKPPRQARSRDKLRRLLDATTALLGERSFDEITVAHIAEQAGVSVGLFYTRFEDKNALLDALYEEHLVELSETADVVLSPEAWVDMPVTSVIGKLVAFTVKLHREKRGLLRALVLRHHAEPGRRYADPAQRAGTAIARVGRLIGSRADEIPHPKPRLAGSLGFLFVLGAIREKILFSEGASQAIRVSDRRLTEELTIAFQSYLGLSPGPSETYL